MSDASFDSAAHGTRRSSPSSRPSPSNPSDGAARGDVLTRFHETRARTTALAEPLSPEDCAIQSMDDASPLKWHLAHTSWYFETFLLEASQGYEPFCPDYRVLFNSYYNLVGAQHPRPLRGLLSRPSLREILAYRRHVDLHVERWLTEPRTPIDQELFELGLSHEEQHQELMLTDLKHLLASHPFEQAYRELPVPRERSPKPLAWHGIPEGLYSIGHDGAGFSFDCERPRHRIWLDAFELGSRLITSGEYLAFMHDGGYRTPELWLADGWSCVQQREWQAPLYWELRDDQWWERTLGGGRPVRPELPVCHVSYYEADAFARWYGARLPTEAEWEVCASDVPVSGNFLGPYLQPLSAPEEVHESYPAQLYGDAWEWTSSAYHPYPGYQPPHGAVGEYNGKFMSNQRVLRGGSCATPPGHVRASYRNFFYPHQRWQFTGIRLARDAAAPR